jgi:hypothetical protein
MSTKIDVIHIVMTNPARKYFHSPASSNLLIIALTQDPGARQRIFTLFLLPPAVILPAFHQTLH